MSQNRFIRIYENRPAPAFSYEEVEHLQNDETLPFLERLEFRRAFREVKRKVEADGVSPYSVCFFVNDSAALSFTIGKRLIIHGDSDIQLTYDELTEMAFSCGTRDDLSIHYQEVLKDIAGAVKEWDYTIDRCLPFMNPITQRVRVYFD